MSFENLLRRAVALVRGPGDAPAGTAGALNAVRAVIGDNQEALDHYERWLPLERIQGEYFASLVLEHLPDDLANEIRRGRLSLLDVGCSCGHLVSALARRFPRSRVEGVDIEAGRIAAARHYYSSCTFRIGDVTRMDLGGRFDGVFTSNVLEHFDAPLEVLDRMVAPLARRFVVSLVPWKEQPRVEGHLFTFDEGSFPERLGSFRLTTQKVIDCRESGVGCWPGFQVLTVYRWTA